MSVAPSFLFLSLLTCSCKPFPWPSVPLLPLPALYALLSCYLGRMSCYFLGRLRELFNVKAKGEYHAETDRQKLGPFGHICRMHNNRKIKELMFGRMEGTNKRGRPHREWLDDIIKWGGMSL